MPSNTQPERSDAAAAAAGGASSKTSLLWAYQLRREHIHLVNRIDDMNLQLVSCTNKTDTHDQTLSNLENLVKGLQAENYTLKNEVTLVRSKLATRIEDVSQQIAGFVSGDGAMMRSATKELELGLRDMGFQVQKLSNQMSEFKADVAKVMADRKEIQEAQARSRAALELGLRKDNTGDLEKTKPLPVVRTETRPMRSVFIVKLKYRKKDMTKQSAESKGEIINAQASFLDQEALSTLTESYIPDSMPPDPIPPIEAIFQKIRQDNRSLGDYFAFTSQLRCGLPRRKQEGHIVEAFVDGIATDDAFKEALQEYLDEFGWVWSNLEIFCKPRALRKKRKSG